MLSTSNESGPIPVAIITGYLGAGKTTLIQQITPQLVAKGERILTIVNDLSPENTDVFAFQKQATASCDNGGDSSRVSALSGGCVCCNLLSNLVNELLTAHGAGTCSYVILECTGVADPAPVVATIGALPALAGKFVVDAVITVINAASLAAVTEVTAADGPPSVSLSVAQSDVMGGHQALGANLVLVNNWESFLARGAVTGHTLAQWLTHLRDFCAEANLHTRVQLTNRGAIDFAGLVWRNALVEADNTLPYYLRTYAAAGKTVGDFSKEGDEEAHELEQLGLHLFTFRCSDVVLSTRKLRAAMSGPKAPGKRLLEKVWRSKGFFDAVDDEDVSDAQGQRKQFRWQSVEKRFDYGEVLPPAVPLFDKEQPNVALTCRIVFMGGFDEEKKTAETAAFFKSVAADI